MDIKNISLKSSFIKEVNISALLVTALLLVSTVANATSRDQAKRIHDRLTGTPPSEATLTSMAAKISAGDSNAAAMEAMDNKGFYNVFLKNYITPWTNQDQTVFRSLNDYTATVIGIIRDDLSFKTILTGDVVYVAGNGVVNTEYSHTDNTHYEELEASDADLGNANNLVSTTQSGLNATQINATQAAGVLTTRASSEEFLSGGTNRALWESISKNHLCMEVQDMNDVSRSPHRVRQDVTRSPGGDSNLFLNSCVGCHAGMDPLIQAFAYYEWQEADENQGGRMVYTDGSVQEKYLINKSAFPLGYETEDDSWNNYWREGKNSVLGWRGANASGNGAKSMGEEVASSRAFSECQVQKAFKQICFREPANPVERSEVSRITDVFEASNYSMKRAFAEVSSYCMGN